MLSEGQTIGVFQLESKGMQSALKGLKPDRFEDIFTVVALYRPGPMENIPNYINRKHGIEEINICMKVCLTYYQKHMEFLYIKNKSCKQLKS